MRLWSNLLSVALVAIVASHASAELKLPAVLSDGMVLQQKKPATIWGWADPGAKVTVKLDKKSKKATADDSGRWSVEIDTPKAGGPYTLAVKDDSKEIELKDVLVGEVWVCSGQSNMQWSFTLGVDNAEQEAAAANYPSIRFFDVPRQSLEQPQQDVTAKWTPCTPETVKAFSSVGYFFGRELHKELNVPIGLIGSNYGGTPAEAWTSREALEAQSDLKPLLERWDNQVAAQNYEKDTEAWKAAAEKAKAEGAKAPNPPANLRLSPHRPAGLYNAMLAPLTPYTVAGAIWYQGESNVTRAHQYRTVFPTMIADWREKFGQKDLPFYFVQIAPYRYGGADPKACAELWEAQLMTYRNVPNTGMAVVSDVGDIKDIHPRNKQAVGHRLALWALAKDYGQKNLVYSGPIYKDVKFKGDKAVVSFDYTGGGLASRDGQPLNHFQVAGEDQQFHPATATIDGEKVVVRSEAVQNPVAVRFGWDDTATPNLMNKEGLPASPFRTDTWKGVTEGKH